MKVVPLGLQPSGVDAIEDWPLLDQDVHHRRGWAPELA
jgi:hypothetical protein